MFSPNFEGIKQNLFLISHLELENHLRLVLAVFTLIHPNLAFTTSKWFVTNLVLIRFLVKNGKFLKSIYSDLAIIHYQTIAFYHKHLYL